MTTLSRLTTITILIILASFPAMGQEQQLIYLPLILAPNPPAQVEVCDCSGNNLNCSDFGTQTDAQNCFDYCVEQGQGDIHRLDSDGDNLACESLPTSPTVEIGNSGLVVDVVDGDTIKVQIDGTTYTVRYILVDTPETNHPTKGLEPYGLEAKEANRVLTEGKIVGLEKDTSDVDRYGRLLRYVYVGDTMVNRELLRQGLARVAVYPPDVKYQTEFEALQLEAQNNSVGMWAN